MAKKLTYIRAEVREKLDRLAELEKRTIDGEVDFLVDRRLEEIEFEKAD